MFNKLYDNNKCNNILQMDEPTGLIYGRINAWYINERVVKLGITSSGKNRDGVYNTGEVTRGYYELVIEIPLKQLRIIDNLLKYQFKCDNVYKGGGTEFYNMGVCEKIEPYLQSLNLKYRVFTKEEIEDMERIERTAYIKNINKQEYSFRMFSFCIFILLPFVTFFCIFSSILLCCG